MKRYCDRAIRNLPRGSTVQSGAGRGFLCLDLLVLGSGHIPLMAISPPRTYPSRHLSLPDNFPLYLYDVGHSPLPLHYNHLPI